MAHTLYRTTTFEMPSDFDLKKIYNMLNTERDTLDESHPYGQQDFTDNIKITLGEYNLQLNSFNARPILDKKDIKRKCKNIQTSAKSIIDNIEALQRSVFPSYPPYSLKIKSPYMKSPYSFPPIVIYNFAKEFLDDFSKIINHVQTDLSNKKKSNSNRTVIIDDLVVRLFQIFYNFMELDQYKSSIDEEALLRNYLNPLEKFIHGVLQLSTIATYKLSEGLIYGDSVNEVESTHLRKQLKHLLLNS